MDDIDKSILQCLKKNSRMNSSAIARKVSLSVTAVIDRIKKLESSGVIKQYTVVLNPEKLGKDITAYISVRLEHPKFNDSFVLKTGANSEITECYYIAGDYDYLLKAVTASSGTLENVLSYIKNIDGVSLTRTIVVLSTLKSDVSCSVNEAAAASVNIGTVSLRKPAR
ncbi:MAG: Lrp/AsnC family transcriptional regulator [Eubacteriales bacterium]|nr:Lrp/AsnC family transcriptional regulator [Eubacteriales bacterium]